MPVQINSTEALLYVALARKAATTDVAILFKDHEDGDNLNSIVLAMAESNQRTLFDYKSAIVNLIQNYRGRGGQYIVCTSEPTPRDIGMAHMMSISGIYYLKEGKIKQIWRANANNTTHFGEEKDGTLPGFLGDYQNKPALKDTPSAAASAWADAERTSNRPLDELMNLGMFTDFVVRDDFRLPRNLFTFSDGSRELSKIRDELFSSLAWAIVSEGIKRRGKNDRQGLRVNRGHNIGSVLRGPNDGIIAWGLNTNAGRPTLHAEVNNIESFQNNRPRAPGSQIGNGTLDQTPILYTTLRSCHMCSGMWVDSGPHLVCKYSQFDSSIRESYLANGENNSKEDVVATRIGLSITQDRHKSRDPVTVWLDSTKVKERILAEALPYYLSLSPHKKKGTLSDADKTDEMKIWENGLKLLHTINNSVQMDWEKHKFFYNGVALSR